MLLFSYEVKQVSKTWFYKSDVICLTNWYIHYFCDLMFVSYLPVIKRLLVPARRERLLRILKCIFDRWSRIHNDAWWRHNALLANGPVFIDLERTTSTPSVKPIKQFRAILMKGIRQRHTQDTADLLTAFWSKIYQTHNMPEITR